MPQPLTRRPDSARSLSLPAYVDFARTRGARAWPMADLQSSSEGENRVGAVTVGGTVALVLIGAYPGLSGGLINLGARPWLPRAVS